MTDLQSSLAGVADDLRREFDRGFAALPSSGLAQAEIFLGARIGGDLYAIRLAEIAGLHAGRRITPLPSPLATLLGVAGFRGQIVPVYDLAALLGYPARAAPRWLALARSADVVALGFDVFEAQWVVAVQDVVAAAGNACAREHVRAAVRTSGELRPIVDLPSVLEMIRKQAGTTQFIKEA